MNILTFDIEEWFHLLDFDDTCNEDSWDKYEIRIHSNVDRILEILEKTNTKATFFVIGWIAKKYPEVIRKIANKYEIGSHTMTHQLVWQQSAEQFKQDVDTSIKTLEDIIGKKITKFRAPGYSIRESEKYAFEILYDLGIRTDCSIFPTHHAHGGMPSFKNPIPSIIHHNGVELEEFPITYKNILGHHIVYSGGGYFRLCPYPLLKKWSKEQNEYLMAYIHPRDLDKGQPMLTNLPFARKFKSYVGLKNAERKFLHYLNEFDFTDIETARNKIDWNLAPHITL